MRELVQRVRYFATEMCTACDIDLVFEANSTELDREANSEIRRDVFLIAKEAIQTRCSMPNAGGLKCAFVFWRSGWN